MELVTPTVGRIVHYWPQGQGTNKGGQPRAAIITRVESNDRVILAIFDEDGRPYTNGGIKLHQGDVGRPVENFCEFPPRV